MFDFHLLLWPVEPSCFSWNCASEFIVHGATPGHEVFKWYWPLRSLRAPVPTFDTKKTRTAFFTGITAPLEYVSSGQGLSENDVVHVELHADVQFVFVVFATAPSREGPDRNH